MFHTTERFDLVFSVSNQIERPRIMVKRALTVVRYPESFNHPRVIGSTIAGTEVKKVTKTKTALPMAAGLAYQHMCEERIPRVRTV